MVAREDAAQLGGDALRQGARRAGAAADYLDVVDGAQPAQQVVQAFVGEQERVAAGDQHVADRRGAGDVVDALLQLGARVMLVMIADEVLAKAVAAVGGADVGDLERDPVGVHVHHGVHGGVVQLGQRIGQPQVVVQLVNRGHLLQPQRAGGIVGIHQAGVVGRDAPAILRPGGANLRPFRLAQAQVPAQFLHRGDALPHLPAPVVHCAAAGRGVAVVPGSRGSAGTAATASAHDLCIVPPRGKYSTAPTRCGVGWVGYGTAPSVR